MPGWLRKVRAVLGLTAVGGAGGALFGLIWFIAVGLLGGFGFGGLGWTMMLFSGFGAFSVGGAALLLAGGRRASTIEDLSPWRVAGYGALAGAVAPVAMVLVLTGGVSVPGLGMVAGISSALGGLLGSGLVVAAKRARRSELRDAGPVDALEPGR